MNTDAFLRIDHIGRRRRERHQAAVWRCPGPARQRDATTLGKSPRWPSRRVIRLRDEAELIEPLLRKAGEPVVLVGHSYDAALAGRAVDENNPDRAAEIFIDYWLN